MAALNWSAPEKRSPHLRSTSSASAAFTLMELLAVVTILAVLMALSMVAYSKVIEQVRRTEATTIMHGLATGVANYHTEYGRCPLPRDAAPGRDYVYRTEQDWIDLVAGLGGGKNAQSRTPNTRIPNPRGEVFYNATRKYLKPGTDLLVDPTGRRTGDDALLFRLAVDGDHDDELDISALAAPDKSKVRRGLEGFAYRLALWSLNGGDGETDALTPW